MAVFQGHSEAQSLEWVLFSPPKNEKEQFLQSEHTKVQVTQNTKLLLWKLAFCDIAGFKYSIYKSAVELKQIRMLWKS